MSAMNVPAWPVAVNAEAVLAAKVDGESSPAMPAELRVRMFPALAAKVAASTSNGMKRRSRLLKSVLMSNPLSNDAFRAVYSDVSLSVVPLAAVAVPTV